MFFLKHNKVFIKQSNNNNITTTYYIYNKKQLEINVRIILIVLQSKLLVLLQHLVKFKTNSQNLKINKSLDKNR